MRAVIASVLVVVAVLATLSFALRNGAGLYVLCPHLPVSTHTVLFGVTAPLGQFSADRFEKGAPCTLNAETIPREPNAWRSPASRLSWPVYTPLRSAERGAGPCSDPPSLKPLPGPALGHTNIATTGRYLQRLEGQKDTGWTGPAAALGLM